jgi:hypothetical protein
LPTETATSSNYPFISCVKGIRRYVGSKKALQENNEKANACKTQTEVTLFEKAHLLNPNKE